MIYRRVCEQCFTPYNTRNPNLYNCSWDCQRLEMVTKHPEWALRNSKLMKLAFEDGIIIEKTEDGITVSNRFEQGDDEQWRIDLHRIRKDANEIGQPISFEVAWQKASKNAIKRIIGSDKYAHPKGNPNTTDKENQHGEDNDPAEDVA